MNDHVNLTVEFIVTASKPPFISNFFNICHLFLYFFCIILHLAAVSIRRTSLCFNIFLSIVLALYTAISGFPSIRPGSSCSQSRMRSWDAIINSV